MIHRHSLSKVLALGLPPLLSLGRALALLAQENRPHALEELVNGGEEELEPGVFDVSVVERRKVREGDGDDTEQRSEEVIQSVCIRICRS